MRQPPPAGHRPLDVHLNPNVAGLPPSATIAINDLSNALRRAGRQVFKLGLGQSPFPVPRPVVEALRRHAAEKDYLPVTGLRALRETVAEHHCRTFGIDTTADDVLIGPGSKELMFLLQLVYCGDLVIPTPTWVSYAPQARIAGRNICLLPTSMANGWQLTPEQLDAFCSDDPGRDRILILTYPANPTGRTMTRAELAGLAEVARAHRVMVLSDEIYGKLHHQGAHASVVPLYPEGTIFSGGLSKWCGAGGWRLGLFVFPRALRWLLEAMAAVGTETFTATSAPIQFAAVRAFQEGPEIERYLQQSRRILRLLGGLAAERLEAAGARLLRPHGAFYLFPDFAPLRERLAARGITSGPQLCRRLLAETGVAVLPGSDFVRARSELTLRIAYVDFDGEQALAAASNVPLDSELDTGFARQHCARVVEGIERLCAWVQQ